MDNNYEQTITTTAQIITSEIEKSEIITSEIKKSEIITSEIITSEILHQGSKNQT